MSDIIYGPKLNVSEEIHKMKYRLKGETFKQSQTRVANALKDNQDHYESFRDVLLTQRFMAAGRVQAAMGAPRQVTPFNCFVSDTIPDSMEGIMRVASEAAQTMRLGGGIGYDFSTLRPKGDFIRSLDSRSSGPLSFMNIFDALCKTIASAGHRRGAQMGVMRVDHPSIREFIYAKTNSTELTQFNLSVGITDAFMEAVINDETFDLVFDGRVYETIKAASLWDEILRNTWDWAEPGILFIDRMNKKNNLWYIEDIHATNPCGEQPLPPHGACLLGSWNLVKFIKCKPDGTRYFDFDSLKRDIPVVVRAMDNIIDRCIYPLPQQEEEAKNKRRMGLGVTGVANAGEALGFMYGTNEFCKWLENLMRFIAIETYKASIALAEEKGSFPLLDRHKFVKSGFMRSMPKEIRNLVLDKGIRNSHLLSVAPTGTISLSADNVSSGIEPVFSYFYDRTVNTYDGPVVERVDDYGYREFGTMGVTANQCSVFDHVKVLNIASKYVDSACSKTCNVGDNVTWDEFKDVYMQAYLGGASGCTTFRSSGKRYGILTASTSEDVADEPIVEEDKSFVDEKEGGACYYDPSTGLRTCE